MRIDKAQKKREGRKNRENSNRMLRDWSAPKFDGIDPVKRLFARFLKNE